MKILTGSGWCLVFQGPLCVKSVRLIPQTHRRPWKRGFRADLGRLKIGSTRKPENTTNTGTSGNDLGVPRPRPGTCTGLSLVSGDSGSSVWGGGGGGKKIVFGRGEREPKLLGFFANFGEFNSFASFWRNLSFLESFYCFSARSDDFFFKKLEKHWSAEDWPSGVEVAWFYCSFVFSLSTVFLLGHSHQISASQFSERPWWDCSKPNRKENTSVDKRIRNTG